MDGSADKQTAAAVGRVIWLRSQSAQGLETQPAAAEQSMPGFTWDQLERQLEDLTDSPAKARIVRPLVSGLRKQAHFKPSELVLRELLCLAWTLMDETFQPGLFPGEEAEMP